ncbi:hypothetical protein BOTBODRAFT_51396 [Botryobasidium botryosum FD-172 SS1]|uniref:Uncharacterized protein n=1 Tax=Botryobasidium botryosum (strain FD-172 SS1) TaxID=930990 RepID=A0A067N7C7_BOTB1|nr:hypothetical protein BOTBODRAFT_51396 [Botryobasidium botryosum FD-172 SS1]
MFVSHQGANEHSFIAAVGLRDSRADPSIRPHPGYVLSSAKLETLVLRSLSPSCLLTPGSMTKRRRRRVLWVCPEKRRVMIKRGTASSHPVSTLIVVLFLVSILFLFSILDSFYAESGLIALCSGLCMTLYVADGSHRLSIIYDAPLSYEFPNRGKTQSRRSLTAANIAASPYNSGLVLARSTFICAQHGRLFAPSW